MTMKLLDNVWVEKSAYAKAERLYYEKLAKKGKQVKSDNDSLQTNGVGPGTGSIAKEVAKARQQIKESLKSVHSGINITDSDMSQNLVARLQSLEVENKDLKKTVEDLRKIVSQLSITVKSVEERLPAASIKVKAPTPAAPVSKNDDDDDDVDLFGSDSETEDAEREKIKQERLAAYAAKKSKKPALIAKSNIILDIKPWDDETDMAKLEENVRKIQMEGLLWGAGKLVPLAYGIHKLQISCVVEDEKVSVDLLTEQIEEIEDYVQSVDIAAFNKI